MSSGWGVTTNAREVRARLDRVPAQVRGPVLVAAVMAGADPVLEAARQKVPVRRGVLRRHLRKFLERSTSTEAVATVTWRSGTASRTPAFYGTFVELGTPERVRKRSGGSTGRMPAQPFLRPAYDERREQAQRAAQAVLASSLMELAR